MTMFDWRLGYLWLARVPYLVMSEDGIFLRWAKNFCGSCLGKHGCLSDFMIFATTRSINTILIWPNSKQKIILHSRQQQSVVYLHESKIKDLRERQKQIQSNQTKLTTLNRNQNLCFPRQTNFLLMLGHVKGFIVYSSTIWICNMILSLW